MTNHVHNTLAIICKHITEGKKPILHVSHEKDGIWSFYCNESDHDQNNVDAACLNCIFENEPSVAELKNLEAGYDAMRILQEMDIWDIQKIQETH
ncbi:MAG: hypothetical protein KDI46_04200 [Alphaproteobacteria bacterium]|nr:hypothetical protein [Alphaproteobacteria bacterium]